MGPRVALSPCHQSCRERRGAGHENWYVSINYVTGWLLTWSEAHRVATLVKRRFAVLLTVLGGVAAKQCAGRIQKFLGNVL